jgi:hypothetical protein
VFESGIEFTKEEEERLTNELGALLHNTYKLNNQMQNMKVNLSKDIRSSLEKLEKSIDQKIEAKKAVIASI